MISTAIMIQSKTSSKIGFSMRASIVATSAATKSPIQEPTITPKMYSIIFYPLENHNKSYVNID